MPIANVWLTGLWGTLSKKARQILTRRRDSFTGREHVRVEVPREFESFALVERPRSRVRRTHTKRELTQIFLVRRR